MMKVDITGPCRGRTGRGPVSSPLLLLAGIAIAMLTSCTGGSSGTGEYVYVAANEATLRDRVATIYNKTGQVHNGERLQVLERMQNKRFVKVRTPQGQEGWLQERYLADQQTFDEFQNMAQQVKNTPSQGSATVEQQVKVHVQPGRKTGFLYMLDEKQKVALLERRPIDRNAPALSTRDDKSKDPDDASDDETPGSSQPAIWEDWWLVRDQQQRAGWVLGRALYLDVPEDVAQYAEGQRIVAAFPLDEVEDQGKKVGEYLLLFTEPKDGAPYDFDQIRVFSWNTRRHRYETAYRERNLEGKLPVVLGRQEFAKEGTLRTFTIHLKEEGGEIRDQTYKFNSPMVRKVYAPGQEPAPKARSKDSRRHTRP
jgi:hypothetical protein